MVKQSALGGFHPGLKDAVDTAILEKIILILPDTRGDACQGGGAERGRFGDGGPFDRNAEDIRLKLHEPVIPHGPPVDTEVLHRQA